MGVRVVPVPGPSALTAALAASGFSTASVRYVGFLPRAAGQRRMALAEFGAAGDTLVAFEAPHRLVRTLQDLRDALGEPRIAVCRELTSYTKRLFAAASPRRWTTLSSREVNSRSS